MNMALPPTIPTSFVPHATKKHRVLTSSLFSLFSFFSYLILTIVFIVGIGVFLYGRVLSATATSKDTQLTQAEKAIDPATAQDFVRLQDRLNAGQTLLKNHIALSGFFTALQSLLPAEVRFTSIDITIDDTGTPKVQGSGIAKSFNALAFASQSISSDASFKDVIFSKMSINKDNSVSFGFSATLDPALITYTTSDAAAVSGASEVPAAGTATPSATTTAL